ARYLMTHPSHHARTTPDKIAYQMTGSGKAVSYRELDARSNQGAHLFRSLGLAPGGHIALLMENRLEFMEICWAAQRSGLFYTAISRYLTHDEIDYIVGDCGARVGITSAECAAVIARLGKAGDGRTFFTVDDARAGFRSWHDALAGQPTTPIADETAGRDMLYSSGTTGRPKGITLELLNAAIDIPNPFL